MSRRGPGRSAAGSEAGRVADRSLSVGGAPGSAVPRAFEPFATFAELGPAGASASVQGCGVGGCARIPSGSGLGVGLGPFASGPAGPEHSAGSRGPGTMRWRALAQGATRRGSEPGGLAAGG